MDIEKKAAQITIELTLIYGTVRQWLNGEGMGGWVGGWVGGCATSGESLPGLASITIVSYCYMHT